MIEFPIFRFRVKRISPLLAIFSLLTPVPTRSFSYEQLEKMPCATEENLYLARVLKDGAIDMNAIRSSMVNPKFIKYGYAGAHDRYPILSAEYNPVVFVKSEILISKKEVDFETIDEYKTFAMSALAKDLFQKKGYIQFRSSGKR